MSENKEEVKRVIAACNEFMNTKILFINRKLQELLEEIARCPEVYNLISDCLNVFNRDKEYDRAFSVSNLGKGTFVMPREEVKVIALVFCILGDINSGKISFDELVGRFFTDEDGRKDYAQFMSRVILPFRDLIGEAFGVTTNVTTVEDIENMEEAVEEEESVEEETLGKPKFEIEDSEDIDRIYDSAKDIAAQINEMLLGERRQTEEVLDSLFVVNSIVIACNKKDFEQLYCLVMGLKYMARPIRDVRFLVKELVDLIRAQVYSY